MAQKEIMPFPEHLQFLLSLIEKIFRKFEHENVRQGK
jgi:hypothetical protein